MGVAVLPHAVGREILEVRYGYRGFHKTPAARLFARVRADPADGRWNRERLHDRRHCVREAALGDFLHVFLAVGMGGAVQLARPEAVAVVVAHQELKGQLPRAKGTFALRVDYHALAGFRRARPKELRAFLNLHHAYAARAVGLELLHKAEIGYFDVGGLGRIKYGCALRNANLYAVDSEIYHFSPIFHRGVLYHKPQRNRAISRRRNERTAFQEGQRNMSSPGNGQSCRRRFWRHLP